MAIGSQIGRGGSYAFFIEGLEALGTIDDLKPQIAKAAQRAVNKTLDHARARAAKEMMTQVSFPGSYLRGEDSRLKVTERASASRFEGVITGRARATSLARFVVSSKPRGGVSARVKPNRTVHMQRAFLMRLRAGDASMDERSNLGLAVRTGGGEKPAAAHRPVRIGDNLYLLYGPSVDQVFRTVREDIAPDVGEFLEREFLRLINLGGGRG